MNKESLMKAINDVTKKYQGVPITPALVLTLYRDVGSVIQIYMNEEEDFLYCKFDYANKRIYTFSRETFEYFGLLPYVYLPLAVDNSEFEVFLYHENEDAFSKEFMVQFFDLYLTDPKHEKTGFDMTVHNIIPLGIYNFPSKGEFTPFGKLT